MYLADISHAFLCPLTTDNGKTRRERERDSRAIHSCHSSRTLYQDLYICRISVFLKHFAVTV